MALLPSPRTSDTNGAGHHGDGGIDLRTAVNLLQTPSVADGTGGHARRGGERGSELLLKGQAEAMHGSRWGEYAAAIHRWETVLGRPAPEPTKPNAKGNPKLSDEFDEFLMGYPAGWITDVPGVTWNETLKACGNGVVPAQGAAAVLHVVAMGALRVSEAVA